MKKVISLLLAVLFCMTSAVSVFADSSESELIERLILTAKEKLPIHDDEVTFQSYYTSKNKNETNRSYSLYWQSEDEQNYKEIRVEIEADGIIRGYNLFENRTDSSPAFAKHSKAEAIEAAKAFIASVDPARLAETAEPGVTLDLDRNYTVTFQRMHGGLPVEDELLRCVVRDDDMQVTNYESPWRELTFVEGELISESEAQKIFTEQLGYRLFYQIKTENYENTAKVVYRSRYDEAVVIDALTGKVMSYPAVASLGNVKNEAAMDTMTSGGSGGSARLSEVERELIGQVSNMLSKEKADTICRAISEFRIGTDYQLNGYSTYRNSTGEYVIQLRYGRTEREDGTGYGYMTVMLEAETGRVVSYYASEYKNYEQWNKQPSLSNEALSDEAEQFLKKYYADEYAQMTQKEHFSENSGGFEYLRLVNDTPVYDNGAWVSFDEKTGALTAFVLNWTDMEFSEPTAAAQEQADSAAMKEGGFYLRYVAESDEDGSALRAVPVYGLKTQPVLDAETLEPLDYNLEPKAVAETPTYNDLEGYYGAAQVQKLLAHDLYLAANKDGGLHPYENITQEAYLRFLNLCINGYDEADSDYLYRRLIRRGVLTAEERKPDAPITRYEGVSYLIRMLGYGDFVKIPDIFICAFHDITPEQTGVTAVAHGLGLINGDSGCFYPDMLLRRGDAMIILHNYLAH